MIDFDFSDLDIGVKSLDLEDNCFIISVVGGCLRFSLSPSQLRSMISVIDTYLTGFGPRPLAANGFISGTGTKTFNCSWHFEKKEIPQEFEVKMSGVGWATKGSIKFCCKIDGDWKTQSITLNHGQLVYLLDVMKTKENQNGNS
jgi:hypothetical protein